MPRKSSLRQMFEVEFCYAVLCIVKIDLNNHSGLCRAERRPNTLALVVFEMDKSMRCNALTISVDD